MRHIAYSKIVEAVKELCIKSAYELPADVLSALVAAAKKESNPLAAKILQQLIENAHIASQERIPLCQDTGLAVVFIEQGAEVVIECPAGKTAVDAINAGVTRAMKKDFCVKASLVSRCSIAKTRAAIARRLFTGQ